nr:hypothetical protein [Tanacetum cinerariifolium]
MSSFDSTCYSEDGNSFTYDPKSNLVHDSLNVFDPTSKLPFYSCEFCGNDARYGHYCTPQVSFIYPETKKKSKLKKSKRLMLDIGRFPLAMMMITAIIPFQSHPMEDEHLDTILATELDEFIKSSVENLVPYPSESEEPFNNQTVDELPPTVPSFDSTCYSEDGNSFTYDSTSNLVHDSPNIFDPPSQLPFYSCEFCGNATRYGHYCTPEVPFVYPEPCYNQDFNFPQDFHDFQQQHLCCENCGVTHEAYQCQPMNEDYYHEQNYCDDPNSFCFDQFQPSQYTINHPIFNVQNDLFDSQNKLMEQLTSMCEMKIPACYDDDDDDYTFAITHKEPDNSLSMGDEHLDTIPAMESDEFIKSSVENLVPNPRESEGKNECDVPACEVITTFSNILFNADYDFYSADDQSLFDEDTPKKIYSNPLFDEETISVKIDPHHFNAKSDLIESLLNHDSSIISSSSKIDSLFDVFAGELTLLKSISLGINETDCDPEEETYFIKRLFDSLMKEIDLSFTMDDPMPSGIGIGEDDYDSERDILILKEFLSNNSFSLPENESFHFDIPLSSRPPAKPPDVQVWGNWVKLSDPKQALHGEKFEDSYRRILSSKSSFPHLY